MANKKAVHRIQFKRTKIDPYTTSGEVKDNQVLYDDISGVDLTFGEPLYAQIPKAGRTAPEKVLIIGDDSDTKILNESGIQLAPMSVEDMEHPGTNQELAKQNTFYKTNPTRLVNDKYENVTLAKDDTTPLYPITTSENVIASDGNLDLLLRKKVDIDLASQHMTTLGYDDEGVFVDEVIGDWNKVKADPSIIGLINKKVDVDRQSLPTIVEQATGKNLGLSMGVDLVGPFVRVKVSDDVKDDYDVIKAYIDEKYKYKISELELRVYDLENK